MKIGLWFLVFLFFLGLVSGVSAAPFADVPSDHWAYDAVSQLAAKGLLEGYPDGLYRGDRAASRYEMAMVTARMLAKLESFRGEVTKEDLDALRKLVNEFRDELDALGVRLKNAEDAIASLEKRVKEVERIKWTGRLMSMLAASGAEHPRNGQAATDSTLSNLNLQIGGVDFTEAIKERWKRHYNAYPMVDGSGMSSMGYLDVRTELTGSKVHIGGTIGLYNAVESAVNSLFWGVSAPYNANRTTDIGLSFPAIAHASLDRLYGMYAWDGGDDWVSGNWGSFVPGESLWLPEERNVWHTDTQKRTPLQQLGWGWLRSKGIESGEGKKAQYDGGGNGETVKSLPYPSALRSLGRSDPWLGGMDYLYQNESDTGLFGPALFQSQPDVSFFGPGYLPLSGVRGYGRLKKLGVDNFRWEGFLGRSVNSFFGPVSQNEIMGAGIGFDFEAMDRKGSVNFSYLRPVQERLPGGLAGPDPTGGILRPGTWLLGAAGPANQFAFGALNTMLPWNFPEPAGVTVPQIAVAPFGVNLQQSQVGPQEMDMWGLDLTYTVFDEVGFRAQYATSDYKAVRQIPGTSASGALFDVGLYGTADITDKWKVNWTGKWISVDPDYDPYITGFMPGYPWGAVGPTQVNSVFQSFFWEAPYIHTFPGSYFIHDTMDYPHNREGWKITLDVPIPDDRGNLWFDIASLEQKKTSDIRNLSQVGFVEPLFVSVSQMSNAASYDTNGSGTISAADVVLDPATGQVIAGTGTLKKGSTLTWSLGGTYSVPETDISVRGTYRFWNWDRKTALLNAPGTNLITNDPGVNGLPSRDNIDLDWNLWSIGATYQWTPKFSVFADYYNYEWSGRYLWPGSFTYSNGITTISDSKNIDFNQTGWALGARFEFTKDAEVLVRYKVLDNNDRTRGAYISSMTRLPEGGVPPATAQEWDWDSTMFTAATRIRF